MDDRKQTVLVVDDQQFNIDLVAATLKELCNVISTTDSREVQAMAKESQPDLILLDVMMPDIDGFEICRMLKADGATRSIPVIFMTALSGGADEQRGLDLGAIDYITKPFRPPVVWARVRNHLELRRQRDLLEKLSTVDGLTGIPNRRAFDTALEREWLRMHRFGDPLSLLMVDVDSFKGFNDGYGHMAGDDCLKAVANAVQSTVGRSTDLVARYGGEEFACILPITGPAGAALVAEKIRKSVEALAIPHAYSPVAGIVTVSVGGATGTPFSDRNAAGLVQRADAQLYEAKRAGRNRMAFAEDA